MSYTFEVKSKSDKARTGIAHTPHGSYNTPAFMPVGTLASVKGITPHHIAETGSEIVLCNAYHLDLRPGSEIVQKMGGLQKFMNWDGPILTDSGGFQVFSLSSIRKVTDEGVKFRSHIDGHEIFITPETATGIQNRLGADIIMAFDECPPPKAEKSIVKNATDRSVAWALRCLNAHANDKQALFGIVQGGAYHDLRKDCAKALSDMGFPGYGIGGLGIGEGTEAMLQMIEATLENLPVEKPRYLMGLGRPDDIVQAIALGVDMFDCVIPTRNARNAMLFTDDGPLRMRNKAHIEDPRPVMEDCDCYLCRNFSRAYLRHLFIAGETLAGVLGSIHNIAYYQKLVKRCRAAIEAGNYQQFASEYLARYNARD